MKPILVSRMKRLPNRKTVERYVVDKIRNADRAGLFHKKTRFISRLPKTVLLKLMKMQGYDGIVFEEKGKIISSVFFQRHGNALHMFGITVEPTMRGKGMATESTIEFIKHAKKVQGITLVRIVGDRRNPAAVKICERLRNGEKEFGIKVLEDGWIELENQPKNKKH